MLLSIVNEFSQTGLRLRGQKPKNIEARTTLEKSGFFRYFITILDRENQRTKNTILRTGTSETPTTELAKEVHGAMETVWGMSGRCPQLYGGINEMFRNSCEHAFSANRKVVWHLGVSHQETDNRVHFSFVDNGKGIIQTLNTGKLQAFLNLFRGNDDILLTAFEDGIESRTGLSWRGKGLPTIHEMLIDRIIINLVVITNNVYLDFGTGAKKVLTESYGGTYYSWEVDQSCAKQIFLN